MVRNHEISKKTIGYKKFDNDRKSRYNDLCITYEKDLAYISFLHGFTDHGLRHIITVHTNLNELIKRHWYPNEKEYKLGDKYNGDIDPNFPLNSLECYVLGLAITLHDTGMGFKENYEQSEENRRKIHHEAFQNVIKSLIGNIDPDGNNIDEILIDIVKSHSSYEKVDLSDIKEMTGIGNEFIRVKLLGAILRIVDEADITTYRTSNLTRMVMGDIGTISTKHHNSLNVIQSIKFKQGGAIDLEINFTRIAPSLILNSIKTHIIKFERELESVKSIFSKAGIQTDSITINGNHLPKTIYFDPPPKNSSIYFSFCILELISKNRFSSFQESSLWAIFTDIGVWRMANNFYIPVLANTKTEQKRRYIQDLITSFDDMNTIKQYNLKIIIFGSKSWEEMVANSTSNYLEFCEYNDIDNIFDFISQKINP